MQSAASTRLHHHESKFLASGNWDSGNLSNHNNHVQNPTSMPKRSNVSLLTEGAAYIQRKKKARQDQVEEIKFDDEARRCVIAVCLLQADPAWPQRWARSSFLFAV